MALTDITKDLKKDLTKAVQDATPVYAAVGVSDLAAEKLRAVRERAVSAGTGLRTDLSAETLQEKIQQVPALALNTTLTVAGQAQESYEALAERGQDLISRLRSQQATQDLVAQAEAALAHGKGAVTTARRAAEDTQRAAKATLTTGRHQAEQVVEDVAATSRPVAEDTQRAAKTTRASARRTATTAKKSAASTKRATKSAATSTRKTAGQSARATKSAANKVGN